MSWFTSVRDTVEGVANVVTGGLATGATSKSSQASVLGSLGRLEQVAIATPVSLMTAGQSNKLLPKNLQSTGAAKASTVAGEVVGAGTALVVGGYALAGATAAGTVAAAKEVSGALKPDNNNTVTPAPIATANPSAPAKDYSGLLVTGGVGLLALKVAGVL